MRPCRATWRPCFTARPSPPGWQVLLCSLLRAAPPAPNSRPAATTQALSDVVQGVRVRGLRFQGNTVFTAEQLSETARSIVDRKPDHLCTIEDLQAIATLLTLKYV